MGQHAILSASGSVQWMHCEGSLFMQAGEEDRSSIYSEEGTAMHAYAAAALTQGRPASAYIGRLFESEEGTSFEVDEEAANYMQVYLDRVAEHRGESGDLFVEQRVYYGDELRQRDEDAYGTSDAIVCHYADELLIVDDLKWGMGVRVFAKGNTQLMLYGLGALRFVAPWFRPKRIKLCVSQPRIGALDEWEISVEELEKWARDQATHAAAEAMDQYLGKFPPNLKPGEKQCRFCAARAICPEAKRVALEAAVEGFDDVEEITAASIKTRPVAPMSLDELAKVAALVPFIEDWCRAVTGRMDIEFIQKGATHDLFKVVRGKRGARYWKDPTAAASTLALCDLPESVTHEPPQPPKLKTPAAMEKIAEVRKSDAWKALQAEIGQDDGKLAVVPSSDAREAVTIDPTSGFEDA